ncbi:hypothetical protein DYB32_007892 [Aphanomyces invadans]|uniref:Uncharacterized protein n=1 Tax=Aphanomyces invadans TaxID=157072 RepID=A0A3R7A5Y2_9STRA|nr:hypothetical protein DYB32_007892 [Aphanomyces invadans]
MLDSINDTMGDGCKVELKRNVGNGVALDTYEIACLDTQAKIKTSVDRVALMDSSEKQGWIEHQRSKGNDLFKAGKYKEASDAYLEALTGLELGGADHDEVMRKVQHPITCNIVACMLKMESLTKPGTVNASVTLYRNILTIVRSRADAVGAQAMSHDVSKLLEAIRRAQIHSKRQHHDKRSFEKSMMKNIGSIYNDKKTPIATATLAKSSSTAHGWHHMAQTFFRCLARALESCFGKRKPN